MLTSATPETLALLLAALLIAGAVAGFLSGLLGVGGGGVLVPVMYDAFGAAGVPEDVRMHMALGTTLAIVAPTVLRSLHGHAQRGAVNFTAVKLLGPGVAIGVVIGILVASRASSEALRWVWVVAGSALAFKLAVGRDDWRIGDDLPGPAGLFAAGLLIGVLSTLMGIGGATFTVPLLTLYGMPVLHAVATATGIGPIIALPGIIGYVWAGWGASGLPPLSLGFVNIAALLVIPMAVLMAPIGVRVAHGIPKRQLELAFAAFLACVVARFLWTLLA